MRYRLRTLLMLLAVLPPVVGVAWSKYADWKLQKELEARWSWRAMVLNGVHRGGRPTSPPSMSQRERQRIWDIMQATRPTWENGPRQAMPVDWNPYDPFQGNPSDFGLSGVEEQPAVTNP